MNFNDIENRVRKQQNTNSKSSYKWNNNEITGLSQNHFKQFTNLEPTLKISGSTNINFQSKKKLLQRLEIVHDKIYELVFLKESITSLLREQKNKVTDFMRDIKRYLFQYQIKLQKDTSGANLRKQQSFTSLQRSRRQHQNSNLIPDNSIDNLMNQQLKVMCVKLQCENKQLKRKYQQDLSRYREQIQNLAIQITSKEEQPHEANGQFYQMKAKIRYYQQKLQSEQTRYVEKIKYLESQIVGLQEQYLGERRQFQLILDSYKKKDKDYSFQQSEIERKRLLLVQKQKQIQQRQILLKQTMNNIQRREAKVSDYEHYQHRREKQKSQNYKNAIRNQYYNNYQKHSQYNHRPQNYYPVHQSQRQISHGGDRLSRSKIDINARLREIQMEKKKGLGIKNSRFTETGLRTDRSSSKGRINMIIGLQPKRDVSTEGVNQKLSGMLELLQQDLNDIK